MKQVSLATALFFCATAAPQRSQAAVNRTTPDIRCLSAERLECGCSLKVLTLACSTPSELEQGAAHFFSELHEGAPLWVNLGGREVSLKSRLPVEKGFTHAPGDRWDEEYEGENLNIRIHYRPGKPTCPPEKGDCEFFDVAADVVITGNGAHSTTYKAMGFCGC